MKLQNTIMKDVYQVVADDGGFITMTQAEINFLYKVVFDTPVPEGMSPGDIIQALDDLQGKLP